MSLNDDKSINNDRNEDRNTLFISYDEDIKSDNADDDINANNNELNAV